VSPRLRVSLPLRAQTRDVFGQNLQNLENSQTTYSSKKMILPLSAQIVTAVGVTVLGTKDALSALF